MTERLTLHHHHHHHHHMSVMESGHLLTRSGLTYVEVSSEVCHDSFCQLGNTVSLSWIVCREAFCLHVLSSSSCIPVVCLEPVLFLIPLQCVNLFCNSILLIYFISAAVILLASLALIVHVSLPYNTTLTLQLLCDISFAYIYFFFISTEDGLLLSRNM